MEKKNLKKRKNKTEVQIFIDKTINVCDEQDLVSMPYVEDYLYGDYEHAMDHNIESVSKKMDESSVYKYLKNHKKLKTAFDKAIKNMAIELMETVDRRIIDIKEERKYEELERIENEKYRKKQEVKNKELAEKNKKDAAQKAIFNEGLSTNQKKAMKKFYNVDIK